jgi:hypothetical protein
MLYCLYTLADITATGQHHGGEKLQRNQQQNFDTVMQTIQLSGNMYYENPPKLLPADIFGRNNQQCWYFEWRMEIPNLFLKDDDPIAVLKDLFEFVPYISGLAEPVLFQPSVFKLGQNIIFDFKQ